MAFGAFKTLQEVIKTYQVRLVIERFIQPLPLAVNEAFASDLTFTLQHFNVRVSEASIGEFIIAPILKEVLARTIWGTAYLFGRAKEQLLASAAC
jgi:hypothetical protein